jgi:hypothetical protein
VAPGVACAILADIDLTTIGGTGSKIITAIETTNLRGAAICTVLGTLRSETQRRKTSIHMIQVAMRSKDRMGAWNAEPRNCASRAEQSRAEQSMYNN